MIGSLLYLTAFRPDIMFSVCMCARYQAMPMEPHLISVKRILRYLKYTPCLGLWYPKGARFQLVGYSDIMFSVCMCARYQAMPMESHMIAVKRILRYLKYTPCLGLWYPKGARFQLVGYSDSDYAGCRIDRKKHIRRVPFPR